MLGQSLLPDDKVILESTGNALEIARVLEPFVSEVVIANPMHVRAVSHAKVKNDQFDARTLAELLAADLVPRVWIGDERTRVLRRLTSRRTQLVRQRTRPKNEISAVLVRNLKGRSRMSDLFGKKGRAWLAELELPDDDWSIEAPLSLTAARVVGLLDTYSDLADEAFRAGDKANGQKYEKYADHAFETARRWRLRLGDLASAAVGPRFEWRAGHVRWLTRGHDRGCTVGVARAPDPEFPANNTCVRREPHARVRQRRCSKSRALLRSRSSSLVFAQFSAFRTIPAAAGCSPCGLSTDRAGGVTFLFRCGSVAGARSRLFSAVNPVPGSRSV